MIRLGVAATTLALLASTAGLARAEGVLNVYNFGNYTSPEVLKKFEQQHKIKVTVTDYDSNDTALAKVRQGGTGFDIVVPSQSYVPVWISEGLVQEIDASKFENFRNIEPEWQKPPFDPERKYTVPWALGTVGVAVNTDAYKGDINTWKIVFDTPDELKGKVNVVPEMNDVIHAAIRYHGGRQCDADKELMRKVHQTLVEAKKNWIAMEYSTIEKMIAGDMKATLTWNGAALRQRLGNKAIAYGYPREGIQLWSDNAMILKDAKNTENARIFLNFMLDPENAAMNSAFHRYATGVAGVDKFLPENMRGAPELTVPAEALKTADFTRNCPPDVQTFYTRIWTDLQK